MPTQGLAFCFPLISRHLISHHLPAIFLPVPIRPIQGLPGRRMIKIVCLMVNLTDTVLLPFVVDAESPIT